MNIDNPFYTKHLITYLWNKRKLLPFLDETFSNIYEKEGRKLKIMDWFAWSWVVSRLLKKYANELTSNDIENYAYIINKSYLLNKEDIDIKELNKTIDFLNTHKLDLTSSNYFISKNYAPKNTDNITEGERVFYTKENALIIDNIRFLIDDIKDENIRNLCLSQLLIKASIHNNTSGVFKWFHKKNWIGHFWGKGEHALKRIKGEINLDYPIFSDYSSKVIVRKEDINNFVKENTVYDLVYYDPPYNQHPYWSNYFMLNIIADWKEVEIQNWVSGIAKKWYKSDYNIKTKAIKAMEELIKNTKSKYIVISYNNEWIIPFKDVKDILEKYWKVELKEQDYNAYRGSRNLKNRDKKVKEMLWILEKELS